MIFQKPIKSLATRFHQLQSGSRLLLCLSIALAVFCVFFFYKLEIITSIMLAWDTFCLLMILLCWAVFIIIPQKELLQRARQEDESRAMSFVLILFSVCISLGCILFLMNNTDSSLISKDIHRTVSLLGVALSWGLLHTIFTLRYAHLYYSDEETGTEESNIGGLDFPKEDKPDYLDFAYFSFVVGMTFQVSDVEVPSRLIRRVVLLHGVLSFVFNTIIVALTIGVISSLAK